MRATIVGAGVSGLTTALVLLEAGCDVDIVARDTHESTVSVVAAAIWTMTSAEPQQAARKWALASRRRFAAIADDPTSGVVPLRQRELEKVDPGPTWWESTPYVRRIHPDELPAGYATGFEIDGFMVEPPLYLRWLANRISALGATFSEATVERLDEVDGDVVFNCSGLGAAALTGDTTLYPIRGQVVAVSNPGIRDGVSDESDIDRIAYVYPRSHELVLGGTRQPYRAEAAADPATTQQILERCAALDQRVESAEVLDVRVGLRPGRPQVRVERQQLSDGRTLIHDYGHSGAGFILSWGCALDAVELARAPG